MGILSKALGVFTRPTVSPETVNNILDKDKGLLAKAGAWYGNKEFTSAEAAELSLEGIKIVQQYAKDTLEENTDRSKARRHVAENFMDFFEILLFMSAVVYPFNPEWSLHILSIATSATVAGVVISITVFFFGSHGLSKFQASKK